MFTNFTKPIRDQTIKEMQELATELPASAAKLIKEWSIHNAQGTSGSLTPSE